MFDVFLGFAFLASATMANKYALYSLTPTFMVALRMLGAGLILFFYYRKSTYRLSFAYFKKDLPLLMGISLLTLFIPSVCKAYALQNMLASKASFFGSLDPFVTSLYAYIFFRETLSFKKIMGILLGFAGMMVILVSRTPSPEKTLMAFSVFSYPELAALIAMAIGRLGWMFVQQLIRDERYTGAELNGLLMTLSGIIAIVIPFLGALLSSVTSTFAPTWAPVYSLEDAFAIFKLNPASTFSIYALLFFIFYTVFFGNVIGYTMYANFLKKHSITFISLAGFSVPMYTYLFDAVLGNPISPMFLVAAAITFTGLMIFYQDEIDRLQHGSLHPLRKIKEFFIK
ncbi:MAG: hypothetical protein AMXMBFR12_04820 [Candidatus Babeliales bacterium]